MLRSRVVLPGESVEGVEVKAGPGLEVVGGGVRVCVPGVLKGKQGGQVWVDYSSKRYVPVKGDRVLGVVVRTGRIHRVDIGAAQFAVLPELAFQGATRRNKPAIQVGEVVYVRVVRAHGDIEPEVSCVEASGKANGLGQLPPSGYVLRCSTGLSRKLLEEDCPVRRALGQHFTFECVVGLNGAVWISSTSIVHTVAVANAFTSSEYMSEDQCNTMADRIFGML